MRQQDNINLLNPQFNQMFNILGGMSSWINRILML